MEQKTFENVTKETHVVMTRDAEILDVQQHLTIPVGEEPPYYKVYMQDLGNVFGLAPAERSVWEVLCANMSFTNIVVLIKPIKEILVQTTGHKFETIRAAIKSLTAKGLLIRQARAVYLVNPKYAARGKWQDIKALRLTIEYSEQGRTIEVKKVNNKVIEIEEHRPKQLSIDFSQEVETPLEELPFPDGDVAQMSATMGQPVEPKPAIKRINEKQ